MTWVLLATLRSAHGQSLPDDVSPTDVLQPHEMVTDRFERREIDEGTRIGDFRISPAINFGIGYDDNVFGQPKPDRQWDYFANYGANVNVGYAHDNLRAVWTADYENRRYADLISNNYWIGSTRLSLSDQITPLFAVIGDGGVQRAIVPRGSPLDTVGTKPTNFMIYDVEPGIQIGDPLATYATIHVGVNQSRYSDVPTSLGEFNQTENDRREIFGDVRVQHSFFQQQAVFLDVRPDTRTYSIDPDGQGFRRDGSGIRADAGIVLDLSDLYKVTLSSGLQHRTYDDSRFGTIDEPDVALDVIWTPSELTTVEAKFTHEYVEEVLEDSLPVAVSSPGYVHNEESIKVDHEFRRNLIGSISVDYDAQTFKASTLKYNILSPSAEIQYLFADGFSLKFDYDYSYQDQNLPTEYSYRNVFTLNFVKRF